MLVTFIAQPTGVLAREVLLVIIREQQVIDLLVRPAGEHSVIDISFQRDHGVIDRCMKTLKENALQGDIIVAVSFHVILFVGKPLLALPLANVVQANDLYLRVCLY